MFIKFTTTLLPLFVAATALAAKSQQTTQPAAPVQPLLRGPVLTEEDGSPVKGVHLVKADVHAVVRGSLAQATMTLTFANSENRVLGGELVFPLPEQATVTGYGLEINGVMVDGVAVEKQRARVIYEKELHQRVDPGLVEHAAGNAFRTRLYPVPANGMRSIKIQYVTDAAGTKDGLSVTLPMGWGSNVDRCAVRIESPDATAAPSIKGDLLTFKQAEHGFTAEGELKNAPDELVIGLPGLAERSVAIEKRIRPTVSVEDLDEQAKGGDAAKNFERFEHFFVINDTPAAPAMKAPPAVLKRLAIVWDAGLSRADADKARELKLLDALLKQWPQAQADLVIFRDKPETPVSFRLDDPDGRGQIIEQLSHLAYDGASDLGGLPLPNNLAGFPGVIMTKSVANYDCILLFTSGLAGVGPETMRKAEVPVYAVSNEAAANHAMLRQVCRESGGQYFNLKRATDEQVLAGVGQEAYALVSIDSKPGEVAEIYPGPGIPAGGRVSIPGKLLAPEATVTLNYGFGKRITHSENFTLKASDATQGELIPRFWAQQKVAEMSMQPGVNDEELARIGKQFNLVTPNTSLLVLETADQYVQYRVVPPKDRPDIYKEFLAKIEQNKAQERQTKEEKIQQVLAMWDGRVKWWEQKYEYPSGLRVVAAADQRSNPAAAAVPIPSPATEPGPAALPPESPSEPPPTDLRARIEAERVQIRFDFDSAISGAKDALQKKDFAEADSELRKARAAATQNPHVLNESERRDLNSRLADLCLQTDRTRSAAINSADAAGQAETAARLRRDAEAQRSDRERSVADLIHKARLLTDDGQYEEAKGVVNQVLVLDPRNDYAIGVLPLLDDHVGSFEQRQFRERFDIEAQKQLGAAEEKRIPYDDILRYPYGWSGRGDPATQPASNNDPGLSDSHHFGSSSGATGVSPSGAAISVNAWDPATPYLAAMKAVSADKAYGVFLEQRKTFGRSPAFYLDCGDYLERIGQHKLAVRVLTDVAALRLADARLLRIAAHRLQQIGERARAINLFETVLKMRPEEPQSHRDLALALSDRADAMADLGKDAPGRDTGQIASDYGRALQLLNQVLVGRWDRFQEIELPCLMEANRIIARVNRMTQAGEIANLPIPLDPRFVKNLECDLRVVMTWDADNTDIDLWVTEPSGERCFYEHNQTTIGGLLSRDFTDGYGPEEYCLRRLMPGKYSVHANYYGSRQQELTGPCTVQATVYTDFGRPTEKKQTLTLRLVKQKDVVDIGSVELGGKRRTIDKAP